MSSAQSTKKVCVLGLVVLLGLFVAGGVPAAESAAVPRELSEQLSAAVSGWIGELAEASKNADGRPVKRGYFSRRFVPAGTDQYQVTAHIEIAGEDTKTTERHLLTLGKQGTAWKVAEAKLEDTFAGIHRERGGQCNPFRSFAFDKEGLHLAASNGTVCETYYQGRVNAIMLHAADLSYRYTPPEHAQALHKDLHSLSQIIEKDHGPELNFKPAGVLVDCDAETCEALLEELFTGLERKPVESAITIAEITDPGLGWARPIFDRVTRERKENPFAHFREPVRAGQRFYSVFVARELDPFSYPGVEEGLSDIPASLPGSGVVLTYDNWGSWEVTFSVFPRRIDIPEQLFGRVYGYFTEKTLASSSPYDIDRRDDEYSRWHQVFSVKGTVDLGIKDPEILTGEIDFGIELRQPVQVLPFFIQSIAQRSFTGDNRPRTLYINSIRLGDKELTWSRTSQLGGLVILPEEMPAGSRLNLHMGFDTRALYKYNHAFTEVSRFGWMPFVRFGDFIDEFELTVRAPEQYTILGIGGKQSEEVVDGIRISHWKADSPVVFPSMTFGKYRSDTAGKDFVAKKLDGTPIPVTVHVDEPSFVDWEISPKALRPIAQQATNAINLYQQVSGLDYPYAELNFVNDPLGFLYGQAPSSLIYLGSGVFRGEGALAPFFADAAGIAKFLKSVTAHEVGHQWWGSRVSNANDRNYWFVESLAEYFSAIYLETVYGPKEYQEQVDEWRRTVLDTQLRASVQNASSLWPGEDGGGSYQASVYNKGPYAFHMLRQTFGDEKFFPFLKQFSQELAAKREIVTLDIQHAAEKALGGVDPEGNPYNVDLSWFFDQWLRGVGMPQYAFEYDVREAEGGGFIVEGVIRQRVVVGSSRDVQVLEGAQYRGVVDVTVKAKGGDFAHRVIIQGAETPFRFKVQAKPLEVVLNQGGGMLSHDVLINKSW